MPRCTQPLAFRVSNDQHSKNVLCQCARSCRWASLRPLQILLPQRKRRAPNETPLHTTTQTLKLKVGLVIFRTNADSQWNPLYNTFHRFLIVETKRFVGSTINVILTRQTCGQRSSGAAESKRRAPGNYVSRVNLLYVPIVEMQMRLRCS